jgi:hypothetical protein
MQGRLLARLGQLEEAKSALLVAVNTYPMIAGAWMSLGDALYDSGDRNEECLMAYMQALALKGSKAVKLVPRILSLVDEFQLTSLAEKCLDAQPSSVWIFWVPLLVQSVSSPVASPALIATGKAILKKISITFPQSVFYALKSGCISDRDQLVAHMKADSRGETIYKALEEMCEYFVEKFATWSDQEISVVAVANALDELRITGSVRRTRLPPGQSATEAGLVKFLDKSVQSSDSGIEVHAFPVNSLVSRISGVMEIMGNYTRYISVPHGSTLESMSSVLVAGVDSHSRIVRDLCGEAGYIRVPVITFIGTNGLRYSYTVRPQVSPRVAGTTSIVYGVLNSVFAHHSQTKQRDVQIRSLQQVPLSENIVLREYRSDIKSYERIITTSGESDDLLVSYFSSSSSVDFYEKSKKFTKSVAANGVTDYLLGIGGDRRTRNEICVSQRDGFLVMLDSDLRIRASLKDPDVPFGLPVFAQNAIGERNMVGLLPATMRAVADSVHSKPRHVFELLALLSKLNEQENIAHGARKRLDHLVDQTGHLCHTIMDLINSAVNI